MKKEFVLEEEGEDADQEGEEVIKQMIDYRSLTSSHKNSMAHCSTLQQQGVKEFIEYIKVGLLFSVQENYNIVGV